MQVTTKQPMAPCSMWVRRAHLAAFYAIPPSRRGNRPDRRRAARGQAKVTSSRMVQPIRRFRATAWRRPHETLKAMSKQWRSTLDKASAWSGQRRQRQRSFPRSYRTPKSCSFVRRKFRAASEVNAFKVTFQPNCAVINCIKEETPHACHPSAPTADRIGIRNPDLDSASDPELPGRYLSDPARTNWALSSPHRALHGLKAL